VIAILGLVIGVIVGIVLAPTVPAWLQPYLPIAVVAALDAVVGAFRALVEGAFDDRIFVVSFLSNVLIASVLVFLGDQLGVGAQMSTGVVVVLAMRIFANAAAVRRVVFKA
jgi:small basic protein